MIGSYLPLRFSIPVLIVLVTILSISCSLIFVAPVIEKQQQVRLQQDAKAIADRLTSKVTYLLGRGDTDIAVKALRQDIQTGLVNKVFVLDSDNRVRLSGQAQDLNKRVTDLNDLHLPLERFQQIHQLNKGDFAYLEDESVLYSLAPIQLPQLGLGDTESGVLVLALSDAEVKQAIREQLLLMVGALLLAMVLVAVILMFLINRMVTARVERLASASQSFSAGEITAFDNQKGKDELGVLGVAFSDMAKQITSIHAQLEANADLLDELLENSPSMIVIRDINGAYLRANPSYLKFAGVGSLSELQDKSVPKKLPPEVTKAALAGDAKVIESAKHYSWELTYSANNHVKSLYGECFPLFDDNGALYAVCTIKTDTTERAERENALRLAQYIFETTNDGIIVTDQHNRIIEANDAFERVTGYSKEEVLGKAPNILNSHKQPSSFYENMWRELDKTGIWAGEIWNRKKSGEIYPEWLTVKSIMDDQQAVTGYFWCIYRYIRAEKDRGVAA